MNLLPLLMLCQYDTTTDQVCGYKTHWVHQNPFLWFSVSVDFLTSWVPECSHLFFLVIRMSEGAVQTAEWTQHTETDREQRKRKWPFTPNYWWGNFQVLVCFWWLVVLQPVAHRILLKFLSNFEVIFCFFLKLGRFVFFFLNQNTPSRTQKKYAFEMEDVLLYYKSKKPKQKTTLFCFGDISLIFVRYVLLKYFEMHHFQNAFILSILVLISVSTFSPSFVVTSQFLHFFLEKKDLVDNI